jgi:demethylmenaquinone methyltransferase / 2-methoxy-6-polyprenyl-1,4-benzoquinol methylase
LRKHDTLVTDNQVRPHPVLSRYYASHQAHGDFVRTLFNRTAGDYDGITRILSLGSGGQYRRNALRQAGLHGGARVLDVAVGTGQVAREAMRICGSSGHVIGLDRSENMLAIAHRSLGIDVLQGRAEELPVADASMDFVSMGYALRHVSCLKVAFTEFRRVLRPGGRLLILEFGQPNSVAGRALARLYLGRIAPMLCHVLGRSDQAGKLIRYCWDTVEFCVAQHVILDTLDEAGFEVPRCASSLGVFRAYTARKPAN